MIKRLAFWVLLVLVVSCNQKPEDLPFFNSADFKPEWIAHSDSDYSKIHKIRPFTFKNQSGALVTEKTFKGKIYVADFFFTTCPGICPAMTKNMLSLQEQFISDPDIMLLSHTVTPWIDTVQQLQRYAEEYKVVQEKWHLVTGEKEDIYDLARTSYFAEKEIGLQLGSDDFLHTENFLLIDKKLRIRGIYNGTIESDINRLVEDVRILKKE